MLGVLKNETDILEINTWRHEPSGLQTAPPYILDRNELWVHIGGRSIRLTWVPAVEYYAAAVATEAADVASAPMPGAVVSIDCAEGGAVAAGDPILVIESMKLETVIRAPRAGIVESLPYARGATFERGAVLVRLRKA